MRFCLVIVGAALAAGCGNSGCGPTDPRICRANQSVARQLSGEWREVGVPGGTSFDVTLVARDTSLAGSGSYTSTSGANGTVDVRGFVLWRDSAPTPGGFESPAASEVVLDFTFANRTVHLDQGSIAGDTLRGVLTFSNGLSLASYTVKFGRMPALPL